MGLIKISVEPFGGVRVYVRIRENVTVTQQSQPTKRLGKTVSILAEGSTTNSEIE